MRSFAVPLEKFDVSEMKSILKQSSLQSADDQVLELYSSKPCSPKTPIDSMAIGTKSIPAVRSEHFARF